MSKTKGLLLAVAAAAMAFTFSCDSGGSGLGEVSSSSEATPSSSSVASSSNSVEPSSSGGGVPSSSSVETDNEPSSSSDEPSSSSVVPSSNSVEPSSSGGGAPSSSSVETDNEPSSSSDEPSSSSIASSSSSVGGLCANFVKGTKRLHYGRQKEQFCDERYGKEYVYVVIGTQTWMAENLDYAVDGSKCYNNQESNCNTYGRLYNWSTAMGLPSSCNSTSCSSQIGSPHRGICPSGWHIPSNDDWNKLFRYVDGTSGTGNYYSPTAGRYLKATSGWNNPGNGTDAHGFSALPGGVLSDGSFSGVGKDGYWWSSREGNSNGAYYLRMYYGSEYADWSTYLKSGLFSVRCLQD